MNIDGRGWIKCFGLWTERSGKKKKRFLFAFVFGVAEKNLKTFRKEEKQKTGTDSIQLINIILEKIYDLCLLLRNGMIPIWKVNHKSISLLFCCKLNYWSISKVYIPSFIVPTSKINGLNDSQYTLTLWNTTRANYHFWKLN